MVGIDIRYLTDDMKKGVISTGVGVFCSELLRTFSELNRNRDFVLIICSEQKKLTEEQFPDYQYIVINSMRGTRYRIINFFESIRNSYILKKKGVKKVWFPFAAPGVFLNLRLPTVSTVHDLIPVHETYKTKMYRKGFSYIINKSHFVITVSQFVKNDIYHTYPNIKKKIDVIYNPVTVDLFETEPVEQLSNVKYILDINAYQLRKNPVTLLRAFSLIVDFCGMDLVFCGGYDSDNCLETLKNEAKRLNIDKHVHFYYSVSIEKRNWLLAHACMLVSPSLSEGFGRTPVEAAIAEKPVVASRSDSLVEVTRGLIGYYQNATDEKELSDMILQMFEMKDDKERLYQISETLRKAYHPSQIAGQYLDVLLG